MRENLKNTTEVISFVISPSGLDHLDRQLVLVDEILNIRPDLRIRIICKEKM